MSTKRLNQLGESSEEVKHTLLDTKELGVSNPQHLHSQWQILLHA